MRLTAIILNYKNYSDLKDCLLSLSGQELPRGYSLHLLIIDNNSGDGSTEKIQKEFSQYEYLFNGDNLGFSRGVNQGLKSVWEKSDAFLLVNNDASLKKDCLANLIKSASLSEKGGICGPTIFYKHEPEKIWQAGGIFKKSRMNICVRLKNKELDTNQRELVDFVSGCIMLLNKEMLGQIGLFDENFYFYGEDLDLCLRAKKAGYDVIYEPTAIAWHNIQEIPKTRTSRFVLENLAKSYFLIAKKHFSVLVPYAIFIFIFLYTPFRWLQIIKGGASSANIFAWIKGGYQGLMSKNK